MNSPKRLAILVIDDDAIVRRLLTRLLRAHDIIEADGGEQALGVLATGRVFDAILCDMEMPHMRGDELFAFVAAKHPDAAKRMIFVTGGTLSGRARRFLEEPGRSVVWKPFQSARLHEAVSEIAARP